MNFAKRVAKLEHLVVPKRRPRIVVRYEGPQSESLRQPTEDELNEATSVITVRFVEVKDGRPVDPGAGR
jgi:hypothetical protein